MLYLRATHRRYTNHNISLYISAFWSTTLPSQLSVKNQFSMLTLWRYYHHRCSQLHRPALLEQLMVSQLTNSLQSVEPEVSFPYSQFISTCLYSELDYSRQSLPFDVFLTVHRSIHLFQLPSWLRADCRTVCSQPAYYTAVYREWRYQML